MLQYEKRSGREWDTKINMDIRVLALVTSSDEKELGSVGVGGQAKGVALEGAAGEGDTHAAELLVVGVPCLDPTPFRLNNVVGLQGLKLLELALVLLRAPTQNEQKAQPKGNTQQPRKLSHN